jgi:diacyltrehalose acyltransferase
VAKHRKPRKPAATKRRRLRKRRSPSLFLLGASAAGLSTLLVFGHATDNTADTLQVQLANAVFGIGGRGDPDAVNVPNKLSGTVVPGGYTYIPIHYPADFTIDSSVAAGIPVLDQSIKTNAPTNALLIVVGYSEGTIVADKEKRNLATDPNAPPATQLSFVMIASPNVQNGGIFSRFPTLTIPFFVTSDGPAQPSKYNTTYDTNEYDPYGDFPAYFNPLSLANSLFAVVYVHPDQYYDPIVPGTTPEFTPKTVLNTAGGTDTYHLYITQQLPLLAPERQLFGVFGLTPLTEPVLSAIEPLLRLVVDMGYTDRQNLNPEVPTQFSFFTPPERILETLAGIPGALTQGANNFVTGVSDIPNSLNAPIAPTTTLAPSNSQGPQQNTVIENTPKLSLVDPSTTPPKPTLSPLTTGGPKLNVVTDDGGKVAPGGTSSTTSPSQGNPLSQLTGTITGLLGGNQTQSSTPPSGSSTPPASGSQTPSGSTSQTQGAA